MALERQRRREGAAPARRGRPRRRPTRLGRFGRRRRGSRRPANGRGPSTRARRSTHGPIPSRPGAVARRPGRRSGPGAAGHPAGAPPHAPWAATPRRSGRRAASTPGRGPNASTSTAATHPERVRMGPQRQHAHHQACRHRPDLAAPPAGDQTPSLERPEPVLGRDQPPSAAGRSGRSAGRHRRTGPYSSRSTTCAPRDGPVPAASAGSGAPHNGGDRPGPARPPVRAVRCRQSAPASGSGRATSARRRRRPVRRSPAPTSAVAGPIPVARPAGGTPSRRQLGQGAGGPVRGRSSRPSVGRPSAACWTRWRTPSSWRTAPASTIGSSRSSVNGANAASISSAPPASSDDKRAVARPRARRWRGSAPPR